MQYLAWRVLCGLSRKIEISFLLVGHTKFAPDCNFGLLKQKFRKSVVGCLDDLARVVDQSAHTNHAQLVGREDGTTLVDQHDWKGLFQPFFRGGAFDGIKSLHHLVFSSATKGSAMVRESCNAEEETRPLLKKDHQGWKPLPTNLPAVLPPPGIPRERGRYLFEKVRPYVPDYCKDVVCPPPLSQPATAHLITTCQPTSSPPATPTPSSSPPPPPPASPTPPPPPKRRRT